MFFFKYFGHLKLYITCAGLVTTIINNFGIKYTNFYISFNTYN
jgi:hypothetical protein